MKIAQQGFRIVYEPNAFAMELPSFSIQDEKKRKVRISAGGFQSIAMLPEALFFWRHFRLSFLYISHRVLRWTLSPVCLILAFVSNFMLATVFAKDVYIWLFTAQVLFYSSAFFYQILPSVRRRLAVFKLPFYFIFMNISVFQGFFKFLQKKQSSAWEKAKRTNYHLPQARN